VIDEKGFLPDYNKTDLYKYILNNELKSHRHKIYEYRSKKNEFVWPIFALIGSIAFGYFSLSYRMGLYVSLFEFIPNESVNIILDTIFICSGYLFLYFVVFQKIFNPLSGKLYKLYRQIVRKINGIENRRIIDKNEFYEVNNQFNNIIINQVLIASTLIDNAGKTQNKNISNYCVIDALYYLDQVLHTLNTQVLYDKINILNHVELDYLEEDQDILKLKKYTESFEKIKEYRLKTVIDQSFGIISYIDRNKKFINSTRFLKDLTNVKQNYEQLKIKLQTVGLRFDQGYQLNIFDIPSAS
jgi:hypothetical protein